MIVPTMQIVYRQGGHRALINVSDFDPSLHEVPESDAGDQGSSEAHNLAKSGSSPEPATTPDVPVEEVQPEEVAEAPKQRGRARKGR